MRSIELDIVTIESRMVDVVKKATTETFYAINEVKGHQFIDVVVEYLDENGEHLEYLNYRIVGNKYDLLMSESPRFALGKPLNEYREKDLWHIIDLIRAE